MYLFIYVYIYTKNKYIYIYINLYGYAGIYKCTVCSGNATETMIGSPLAQTNATSKKRAMPCDDRKSDVCQCWAEFACNS